MRVVYLLNGSALSGGVKVVYQQARALRRLGVEVEVLTPEPPSPWFPGAKAFTRQVESLEPAEVGRAEVVIGTMWHTVPVAAAIEGAVSAHLCQCYEAMWEGLADRREEIDSIYELPTLKLAVSPHLAQLIRERFRQRSVWIPQVFEPEVFCPPEDDRREDGTLRVLVAGQWDLSVKGVEWGLEAMKPLVEEGWLRLVRLSPDYPPSEIGAFPDAERHVGVPPAEVPGIVQNVDAYVGLSDEVEGFGLPALEAMGCARPCVLTDIGATRALDPFGRASIKIPHGGGKALRAALRRLRDDRDLRQKLGRGGRLIAEGYSEERTARALLAAFERALRRRRLPRWLRRGS
jgi:glycosyltransferase involved in cell wall biosynthesis